MNDERLKEAKAKVHELNQALAELNSFVQSAEGITPLMRLTIEQRIDQILALAVQLLRITK